VEWDHKMVVALGLGLGFLDTSVVGDAGGPDPG